MTVWDLELGTNGSGSAETSMACWGQTRKGGVEGGGALYHPAVMSSISAGATLSPLPQNLLIFAGVH